MYSVVSLSVALVCGAVGQTEESIARKLKVGTTATVGQTAATAQFKCVHC